jgi:hypothetical protein
VKVSGIGVNVAEIGVDEIAGSEFGMAVSVCATTVASTSGVGDAGTMASQPAIVKITSNVKANFNESVNDFLIGSSFHPL